MSEKIKLLIADDNVEFCGLLERYLKGNTKINLIGTAKDGIEAMGLIDKHSPDIVILDMVMPNLDGFGVLELLEGRERKPRVLMLSPSGEDEIVKRAVRLGADYYLVRPVSFELIERRIEQFSGFENECFKESDFEALNYQRKLKLKSRITEMVQNAGVPSHINGYHYLKKSIFLVYYNRNLLSAVTKELYPSVARSCGVKTSSVEKSIRNAIQQAWNRGKEASNSEISTYSATGRRPTNSEFIASIVEKIELESEDTL